MTAKKNHRRNCWTCVHNTTTVTDPATGEVRPCTPWCQPYQDEWIDDDSAVRPDGVIAWVARVGLHDNDDNMPAKKTPPCPRWGRIRLKTA